MTKGQRRLAAIVLALLGIYGTLAALEDRVAMKEQAAQQSEMFYSEQGDSGKE